MPVDPSSRFAGFPLYRVRARDGGARQAVGLRYGRLPVGPAAGTHRVAQGEQLDELALRYLGSERLWWRILDVNPLRWPLDLEPGELIAIPDPSASTQLDRSRSF
jgi:hypothetical protein